MYWLFQSNPGVFRLRDAMQAEALRTFAVTSHKQEIKKGDHVILWQSGREAGCYGLARITSEVKEMEITEAERPFFSVIPMEPMRVELEVEYNFWSRPITWEMISSIPAFDDFNAGVPGTNFKASEAQYNAFVELAKQLDILAEPEVAYGAPPMPAFPLNMILYGPPGTGKTYQTINYALSIIENRSMEELALEDRQALRHRFETYMSQGQIAFVTFHQSFTYEDFIEGIKPTVLQNGNIAYVVMNGIFKLLCLNARRCVLDTLLKEHPNQHHRLKFNQLYKAFLDYIDSKDFQYFETPEKQKIYVQQIMQNGDLSLRKAIAFNTYTIEKQKLRDLNETFPNMENLSQAQQHIDKNIRGSESELYWTVFATLKNFEEYYMQQQEQQQEAEQQEVVYEPIEDLPVLPEALLAKCKRYVLIIDEINRGNAAGIFGELISLLEAEKREGKSEALTTILPYSKTFFSVPPNLYLLGTMNTADRSLESLDVALRRRFAFREVPPNPQVIKQAANRHIVQGVNLVQLLDAINHRIELLLDREHRIGHAYFFDIETLDDLRHVFSERIMPLLQEYFFDDYGKIGLILGRDFVIERTADADFANFEHPYASTESDRRIYEIANIAELDEGAFIRIYNKNHQ